MWLFKSVEVQYSILHGIHSLRFLFFTCLSKFHLASNSLRHTSHLNYFFLWFNFIWIVNFISVQNTSGHSLHFNFSFDLWILRQELLANFLLQISHMFICICFIFFALWLGTFTISFYIFMDSTLLLFSLTVLSELVSSSSEDTNSLLQVFILWLLRLSDWEKFDRSISLSELVSSEEDTNSLLQVFFLWLLRLSDQLKTLFHHIHTFACNVLSCSVSLCCKIF